MIKKYSQYSRHEGSVLSLTGNRNIAKLVNKKLPNETKIGNQATLPMHSFKVSSKTNPSQHPPGLLTTKRKH